MVSDPIYLHGTLVMTTNDGVAFNISHAMTMFNLNGSQMNAGFIGNLTTSVKASSHAAQCLSVIAPYAGCK